MTGVSSTTSESGKEAFDVVVVGAGYVGLATAVSIAAARPSLSVVVVDAAPPEVWKNDTRASAIAAAAGRMLESLGCWEEIAPEAQAITEMIVTDSRTADPVRPVFSPLTAKSPPANPLRTWSPTARSMARCAVARRNWGSKFCLE